MFAEIFAGDRQSERETDEAVFLEWRVEGSEKLAVCIQLLGPVATFCIQRGKVLAVSKAVESVFPRRRVVNVSDQIFVQAPRVEADAETAIFLDHGDKVMDPLRGLRTYG